MWRARRTARLLAPAQAFYDGEKRNDEADMLDKSHIGTDSGERRIDVEKSQLKLFCQAIGETNPIYFDDEAARAAGYRGAVAPPTFAQTLDFLQPPELNIVIDVLNAPLNRLLHGEQQFDYFAPICAGDTITLSTRLADIYDKKGGALEFIVLETTLHNQNDELCAKTRSVAVLRN